VPVGEAVGLAVADDVGLAVGEAVGLAVADGVGLAVGEAVGLAVGDAVGLEVGEAVGLAVADAVGLDVGEGEGCAVIGQGLSETSPEGVPGGNRESNNCLNAGNGSAATPVNFWFVLAKVGAPA